MDLTGGTFRSLLAVMVAMWSPLWCCCALGDGGSVSEASGKAAESCHAPAEPPPCSGCEGDGGEQQKDSDPAGEEDGDTDRRCECDEAARPAAVPEQPIAPDVSTVQFMSVFTFALDEYASPGSGADGVFFAGDDVSPSGEVHSLLSLRCQLII